MREPRTGDLLYMTSFKHTVPGLTINYKVANKKNIAAFLLLGEIPKDMSKPLQMIEVMAKMGWHPDPELKVLLERQQKEMEAEAAK